MQLINQTDDGYEYILIILNTSNVQSALTDANIVYIGLKFLQPIYMQATIFI